MIVSANRKFSLPLPLHGFLAAVHCPQSDNNQNYLSTSYLESGRVREGHGTRYMASIWSKLLYVSESMAFIRAQLMSAC